MFEDEPWLSDFYWDVLWALRKIPTAFDSEDLTEIKWFSMVLAFFFLIIFIVHEAKTETCSLSLDSCSHFHCSETLNESSVCEGFPHTALCRLQSLLKAVSQKSTVLQ